MITLQDNSYSHFYTRFDKPFRDRCLFLKDLMLHNKYFNIYS